MNDSGLDAMKLQTVIERIVEVAHPEEIILFGSAVRGETRINSDIDLLVVMPEPVHRGRLTAEIYMNLIGVGQAVDVIVATRQDIAEYQQSHSVVIASALREGKSVYERPIAETG